MDCKPSQERPKTCDSHHLASMALLFGVSDGSDNDGSYKMDPATKGKQER